MNISCRPAAGWRCEREIAADCRGYFERKNLSIDKRSENCGKIRLNFRNTCDRMGAGTVSARGNPEKIPSGTALSEAEKVT